MWRQVESFRVERTTAAEASNWEHAPNIQEPARKLLDWTGGRQGERVGIPSVICTLRMGVGQIMQVSLGILRTLVFTLNVMEPLEGFEHERDDLFTRADMLSTGIRQRWKPGD